MNWQKKDFQDESCIINEDDTNNDENKIVSFSNDFILKDCYVAKQKHEITCGKIELKALIDLKIYNIILF
jgi:hypothetical protein